MKTILRKSIKRTKEYLLARYKDTLTLVLIGSVADGTNKKDSDIDIVWVKTKKLNYDEFFKIKRELNPTDSHPKIQIVPFAMRRLKWHFDHSSTMAHSIKNGAVIFKNKNRRILNLLNTGISLPSKEWMSFWLRHWLNRYDTSVEFLKMGRKDHKKYCKNKCECHLPDDIARVVVNFAILYLELKGIVPISKSQIRKAIKTYVDKSDMKNIELALKEAGKDKRITLEQNINIMNIAKKLRRRLLESELMKITPAAL